MKKYLKTHKQVTEKLDEISRLPTPEEKVALNELNHRFIELLGRKVSQNYYLVGEEDLIDLYFREGKELEEPIEFSFKSVEDAAKYVCVLEGSRNQKLFPDIVSGPRGAYKSEGVSIFFDSNAQAALKSLLDQGYNIEPDTRGGQSFKIVEDKHTIDNIVKKYKLTLFDKSTYSGDISDYIDRHTKIDSKTGVHTVHNSVKDLLKYGHANRRDNYQNKYNNQDYWENDMNIYEQLNKINDKESLSENYNVKNVKELKKLQESCTRTVTEGTTRSYRKELEDILDAYDFSAFDKYTEAPHVSHRPAVQNIKTTDDGFRARIFLSWDYPTNSVMSPEEHKQQVAIPLFNIVKDLINKKHPEWKVTLTKSVGHRGTSWNNYFASVDIKDNKLTENVESSMIPAPWNKYLEIDDYTPEEGEYNAGDRIGEYTLVAYLAPKSAYEDRFDGWPMLFKNSSNNYVVGETSHDRVYAWNVEDFSLTESSTGREAGRSYFKCVDESKKILMDLERQGFTEDEIKSTLKMILYEIDDRHPETRTTVRQKFKNAFSDLNI